MKSVAYGLGESVVLGHSLIELIDRYRARVPVLDDLRELGGILDQYYVSARYPNGLPGGVPFEVFGERQAREAIGAAERFVNTARQRAEG